MFVNIMKIYPLNILKKILMILFDNKTKIKWKQDNLIKKLNLITSKLIIEKGIERKN